VYVNGTFRIVTGTVYGSDAAEGLKNIATNGAVLYVYSGRTDQRGYLSGSTWISRGNLSTTSDTISAANGELQ
jgi:hypothetical protein